jgi:hypothetical protein
MNPAGSLWQKWDLRIHTPASFQWTGKKLHEHTSAEREQLGQDILSRLNRRRLIADLLRQSADSMACKHVCRQGWQHTSAVRPENAILAEIVAGSLVFPVG